MRIRFQIAAIFLAVGLGALTVTLVHDTPSGRAVWATYMRESISHRLVVLPQIRRPG